MVFFQSDSPRRAFGQERIMIDLKKGENKDKEKIVRKI